MLTAQNFFTDWHLASLAKMPDWSFNGEGKKSLPDKLLLFNDAQLTLFNVSLESLNALIF